MSVCLYNIIKENDMNLKETKQRGVFLHAWEGMEGE